MNIYIYIYTRLPPTKWVGLADNAKEIKLMESIARFVRIKRSISFEITAPPGCQIQLYEFEIFTNGCHSCMVTDPRTVSLVRLMYIWFDHHVIMVHANPTCSPYN